MYLDDLKQALDASGFPVAYNWWPEDNAPPMPYICYRETETNNLMADGIAYYQVYGVEIELYTETKDTTAEKRIQDALTSAGIPWQKGDGDFIDERCYLITYNCEV